MNALSATFSGVKLSAKAAAAPKARTSVVTRAAVTPFAGAFAARYLGCRGRCARARARAPRAAPALPARARRASRGG